MNPIKELSCANCRRVRPVNPRDGQYCCKHKSGFSYLNSGPICDDWLPSKSDLRIWIERANNETNLNQ